MAFRTVIISHDARLRLRAGQLVVEQDETITVPAEDIAVLVLEHPRINMSCAALSRLASYGVSIVTCDERHLPSAIVMPCCQHSRQLAVMRLQMEATKPLKKRLWQAIVKCKIENQARCLDHLGLAGAKRLREYGTSVTSGDSSGAEAFAARYYFARLMPETRRHSGEAPDCALDYGYAVMRAAVARYLVGYGLYPPLGVHHDAQLNAFNLADDLLEPYRPIVDQHVFTDRLSADDATGRASLVALLHGPCEISGQLRSVLTAIDLTAQSLVRALRYRDPTQLALPLLTAADPDQCLSILE